jgi:hypothetical protein
MSNTAFQVLICVVIILFLGVCAKFYSSNCNDSCMALDPTFTGRLVGDSFNCFCVDKEGNIKLPR